jgi:hypothetical protein
MPATGVSAGVDSATARGMTSTPHPDEKPVILREVAGSTPANDRRHDKAVPPRNIFNVATWPERRRVVASFE